MEYECKKNTRIQVFSHSVYYDYPAEACAVYIPVNHWLPKNLYNRSFANGSSIIHQSWQNPKVIEIKHSIQDVYPAAAMAYFGKI